MVPGARGRSRDGDEVPQFYIHQKIAPVTRPVMQLKGFQRITLHSGEKKTVEFTITPDTLSMLNTDMQEAVEPGIFELMVGPSSDQTSTVNLAVTGPRGETGLPLPPPPPAGSESGVVSNFDDLKVAANYGSWMTTSDSEAGGKSTSAMQGVWGGANGSKGALKITGEIVSGGAPFNWAGVFFFPGSSPNDPANLSGKKMLSFWAKGDGKSYAVAVQTESNSGQMPAIVQFTVGPD